MSDRLREIERTHRHATATRPTETDSWLNGYRDDVRWLLAQLDATNEQRIEWMRKVKVERERADAIAAELASAQRHREINLSELIQWRNAFDESEAELASTRAQLEQINLLARRAIAEETLSPGEDTQLSAKAVLHLAAVPAARTPEDASRRSPELIALEQMGKERAAREADPA